MASDASDEDIFDYEDEGASGSDIDFDDGDSSINDDVDMDQDMGLSIVLEEKNARKAHEVEYQTHSISDIRQTQETQISNVASVCNIDPSQAAILLRHYRWNKERIIEAYMDDPERTLRRAGIVMDDDSAGVNRIQKLRGFECEICFDDDNSRTSYALQCGHRACTTCWSMYLYKKIKEEGESSKVQCLFDKCHVIVDEKTVELLVQPDVFQRYVTLLNRAYVDDNDYLKWCPAPNCEYAVECHVPASALDHIVPTVRCGCSHRFCFGCGLQDHQPCLCPLVKRWLKKCKDDSETANWISANTKECMKCSSTIEKNGGCNHMTCRKCGYEFCWICMGPWSEHGSQWYNCNRYEEKSSTDARDQQAKSRASLERYLHYYNRYANHDQSAKLDRELFSRTEKKMGQLQISSDMSWIEVQFLKNAVDTLSACRQTLKWSYALAFYLEKSNMTEIFEQNQADLEFATENLSELCEKPVEIIQEQNLKQVILDKAVYVKQRQLVLLEDTAKGLAEGRWEFNVHAKG